eukprot:CAMPEP_0181198184 /NCGR_PEP_ID=MMETSP1096-20121128/16470_1 /TAXON_ID=156174 ORGANISM="Chrysochromulina ericina, Strain CCMP281" /NCGR_SAMPLE_ID=MMETSP1096 /ASSEMBLY_ACC=CAM_ASM_000453 /LENGTH=47 /DNA_ID= /DNA_START= /DNA_END= /DNA_ORIENTATION=
MAPEVRPPHRSGHQSQAALRLSMWMVGDPHTGTAAGVLARRPPYPLC